MLATTKTHTTVALEDGTFAVVSSTPPRNMEIIAVFYDEARAIFYSRYLNNEIEVEEVDPVPEIIDEVISVPVIQKRGPKPGTIPTEAQQKILDILKAHMDEHKFVRNMSQLDIADETFDPKTERKMNNGSIFHALKMCHLRGFLQIIERDSPEFVEVGNVRGARAPNQYKLLI